MTEKAKEGRVSYFLFFQSPMFSPTNVAYFGGFQLLQGGLHFPKSIWKQQVMQTFSGEQNVL